MDVSTLRSVTEELATILSEVTHGDLGQPTPCGSWDIGDLYLHLIAQNFDVAAAITGGAVVRDLRAGPSERDALGASVNHYGGGYEEAYRFTAQLMTDGFAVLADHDTRRWAGQPMPVGTLYELQLCNTVRHTRDLAHAMGFDYEPAEHLSRRALRTRGCCTHT